MSFVFIGGVILPYHASNAMHLSAHKTTLVSFIYHLSCDHWLVAIFRSMGVKPKFNMYGQIFLAFSCRILSPRSKPYKIANCRISSLVLTCENSLVDSVCDTASKIWMQNLGELWFQAACWKHKQSHCPFKVFQESWMLWCSRRQLFGCKSQRWGDVSSRCRVT